MIDNETVSDNQMKEIFYVFGADYYVWPLEVHYMSYLINENIEPNEDELNNIVEEFVDNNKGLTKNFSEKFLLKYKNKCLKQLKFYNSLKSFHEKKNYIMSYWNTFDNYSLSIMYLKFINLLI